jgi:two-component system response regulator RegA
MSDVAALANVPERSLLIVDDDKSFVQRLARAMESRGFTS